MNNLEIKFDLWPDGTFDYNDAEELDEVLSNFGNTIGGVSSDLRGDVFQIIIEFIAGAVAAGFFAKLGEDIYKNVKKKFIKIISKPFDNDNEDIGILWVYTYYNKLKIRITLVYSSEKDIENFLNVINRGFPWLINNSAFTKINTGDFEEVEFEYAGNIKKNPLGWKHSKKLIYKIRKDINGSLRTIYEGEIK